MRQCTEATFLKDVVHHQLTVKLDKGVYRHIGCGKPGSRHMYFELVTYPGCLAYSGDMGCFLFERLEDMFEFFRSGIRDGSERLHINPGYWSEKLVAVSGGQSHIEGAKEFSEAKFRTAVAEHLDAVEASETVRAAVREEVLEAREYEGLHEAVRAIHSFECKDDDGDNFIFQDFESDCTEYTHRFLWCLYAIVWAIRRYDAATESPPAVTASQLTTT